MESSEKRHEEAKQFAVFVAVSSIFLIGMLFYFTKDKIGVWLFKLAYCDLLIGEKLYQWFHVFNEIPFLKKIFFQASAVNFNWGTFSYIVTTENGNSYNIISYTIKYLWPVNAVLFTVLFGIEYFILLKLSKLSSKFRYEGIKNKQISLYFNDKKLQNFKRKTINIWDTVNQKEVKQFVFNDYFPPYFPEDDGWLKNYIENSIYYSLHQINLSEERYNDIKKVWKSIVQEHKITKNKRKILPILKKYQFKRFEYMDKENLLDNIETAEKELAIFITEKNKNAEGAPVRNLFNSDNANEKIREYIRKYFNEYYLSKEEIELFADNEEERTVIDWTHIILEELKVYFEVKLFRKDKNFNKTFFSSLRKNQVIRTPLLIPEKFNEKKRKNEIIKGLKRKGIQPTKEKIKRELNILKKEFEKRNAEKIIQAKKYYKNLKYLVYGVNNSKKIRFKQPILKRTYIMTPFNGMKKLKNFETPGISLPTEILNKYIIEDYEGSLKRQINELKNQIKEYQNPLGFFKRMKNVSEEEINNIKALIAELESRLDKDNEESRKAKITEILKTHKFEETYIVSLWEYGMNLVNLPTGRLSIVKKENIVFWYALTSLGRPFTFKAGIPIEIMRQIEKEKHSSINRLKEKFEAPDTDIKDFVSKETIEEIRRNSLDYDDEEDDYII